MNPELPPTTPPTPPTPAASPVSVFPEPAIAEPAAEPQKNAVVAGVLAVLAGIFNWVIVPVAIVFILHNFVFQAFHVVGLSMTPTLQDADYLIISKLGATGAKLGKLIGRQTVYIPKHGEIIVFHYPKDPSLVFVKRVIGVPGDHVVVKDGKVTIFNAQNPAGYDPAAGIKLGADTTLGSFDDTVPAGNVFVIGDNRQPSGSFDSREWGYLSSSYIIGEAVVRLLPLKDARTLLIPTIATHLLPLL